MDLGGRQHIRRFFVGLAVVMASLFVVGRAHADSPLTPPIVDRGLDVVVTPWAEVPFNGASAPRLNAMATAGDRIFVVEDIAGRIWEIAEGADGPEAVLFLDVAAAIDAQTAQQMDTTNLFHGGLRGLAFHPDFAVNGRFYTSVMETKPAVPNSADYLSGAAAAVNADGVLVEWQADGVTGLGDPASYRQVFRVGIPFYDHPIKQIAFNPFAEVGDADHGLLYIGHGDGSVLSDIAGTGQANDALGKVLRIDPLESGGSAYSVPADNPFVGNAGMLDEVWSLGHRNPHHLAFVQDSQGGVHLVVAEPGRDNVEEINVVTRGGDYGWSDREGTFVHLDDPGLGIGVGVANLPANDVLNDYVYPAAQIGHDPDLGQQAIAGGYATSNGSALDGHYLSADFPRTGLIWHAEVDDLATAVTELAADDADRDSPDDLTQAVLGEAQVFLDADGEGGAAAVAKANLLDVFDDAASYDGTGRADVRFGQGPDGELYVLNKRNGIIYLVLNSLPVEPLPVGPFCGGRQVTVDLAEGEAPTTGDDVVLGTSGDDVINGLGGNDVICGGDGDDLIDGGTGDDRLYGQDGDDTILGGVGRDRIAGGAGHDVVHGGANRDLIDGNRGRDIINGDSARDRIQGGAGDDTIAGNGGNDRIKGGGGTDEVNGGRGEDLCLDAENARNCER